MKNVAVQLPWEVETSSQKLDLRAQNDDTLAAHPSGKFVALCGVLIALQILDGILTLSGMHTFGLAAEGNPLLRGLMGWIGPVAGLVVTKLLCIGVIVGLYSQMAKLAWLPAVLTAVAGLYTVFAVIPWTILLLSEYLA